MPEGKRAPKPRRSGDAAERLRDLFSLLAAALLTGALFLALATELKQWVAALVIGIIYGAIAGLLWLARRPDEDPASRLPTTVARPRDRQWPGGTSQTGRR